MDKCSQIDSCGLLHAHEDVVSAINERMPGEDALFGLSEFFKVFGDSGRVRILLALRESEMCVCDLAAVLGMTQSAVSHQLKLLRLNHLVKLRREGKASFYSLADSHIELIINQGLEHIAERMTQ